MPALEARDAATNEGKRGGAMNDRLESPGFARFVLLLAAIPALAACEPFALTAFGVGSSTAVSHSLGGITYRTFTAPAKQVKTASLSALNRMGIKLAGTEKGDSGEILRAT